MSARHGLPTIRSSSLRHGTVERAPSRCPTVLLLLAALALGGCTSEPELEFAEWTLPVAEETRIVEYAGVPLGERDPGTVQLIDDLVIGADLTNPDAVLYQASDLAVADNGTIFVADIGSQNIKVFGADATHLATLGREGQGPGEFAYVGSLTIAGELLLVRDVRNRRFSVWTLDGRHVADHTPADSRGASSVQGLADETLVWSVTERNEDRSGERIVVRGTPEGEVLAELFRQPIAAPVQLSVNEPLLMLQSMVDSLDDPRLVLHVGGRQVVYLSALQEYQVLAMTPDGTAAWALRVAWPRLPLPEAQKQSLIDSVLDNFPVETTVTVDQLEWPERSPSIVGLSSDGAGRLYVFPTPEGLGLEPPESWPVDVYSPDGGHIASGTVPYRWSYARGDYVYGTRPDDNDETVVVRYRLLVNGQ